MDNVNTEGNSNLFYMWSMVPAYIMVDALCLWLSLLVQ